MFIDVHIGNLLHYDRNLLYNVHSLYSDNVQTIITIGIPGIHSCNLILFIRS